MEERDLKSTTGGRVAEASADCLGARTMVKTESKFVVKRAEKADY